MNFEWDENKNLANQAKHGVSFEEARRVFADPGQIIIDDLKHSGQERRFFCYGSVGGKILTVRFTYRQGAVRIIGAGKWRDGEKNYEKGNAKNTQAGF